MFLLNLPGVGVDYNASFLGFKILAHIRNVFNLLEFLKLVYRSINGMAGKFTSIRSKFI